ncbi:hypothetical protein [Caulobacter sp. 17J65-9]|uniref:hypothetical protein n=1 Tax=Caulobacter sp. 17J65-9 TaxID=2709382 RepID=UPI0013C599F3|nr:hypothetical protein [Caulobacter sp. 17J65-9]NEX93454.1 hypothetical protein [Caulobacter sp. 17J65-9]
MGDSYAELRTILNAEGLRPHVTEAGQTPAESAMCTEREPARESSCVLIFVRADPEGRSYLIVETDAHGPIEQRKVQYANWATAFQLETFGLDDSPVGKAG